MTPMFVMYVALLILAIHLGTAVDAFSVPKWSVVSAQRQRQRTEVCWTSMTSVRDSSTQIHTAAIASSITAIMVLLSPKIAMAATEVELAELPPPWIPVVFGIGLVVGVGLLTGSLGDVIEQESQLGLQSGARAKKEIDRSRSSYFKKK